MGIRCADHVTPLYPQKFALTSPTGGGRSVGIVRSRTKATEFTFKVLSLRQDVLRKLCTGVRKYSDSMIADPHNYAYKTCMKTNISLNNTAVLNRQAYSEY